MSKKRWISTILTLIGISALAWFITSDIYPAVRLRCEIGFSPCPAVEMETATETSQDIGNYLVREITEPARFLIFYERNGEVEEIEYTPDTPLPVLPTREGDAVLIYSNYPFSRISFPWKEWEGLPKVTLHVHRLEEEWEKVATAQTGRVPAGPPDKRGYRIGWGCKWYVSHAVQVPSYNQTSYALKLTSDSDSELPEGTTIPIEFLPCVPTWNADNPNWEVLKIERLSACENRGISGWSGKVIQVWVEDELGAPLSEVEVEFTSAHGYGIAWDRKNVGGWTSRFGVVEWDTWGKPTRYIIFVNGLDRLIWNLRTDLHYEYCRGGWRGGWRPTNRPGLYSYRVWVRER